jgi:hypothetical protein
MNEIKIYIKGNAGFKPKVMLKLGDAWVQDDRHINMDTIMTLTTVESELETLKESIGDDLIMAYKLQFLTSLNEHDTLELSKAQRSDVPLKMSIWADKHSNIKAREVQMPQHDPVVTVF